MYAAKDEEALKKAREESNVKDEAGDMSTGGSKNKAGTSAEEESDSGS